MKLHEPVLLRAVLDGVQEIDFNSGLFLDGTFGRGGHSRALLETYPDITILALDCDEEAVAYGENEMSDFITSRRLEICHRNFTEYTQSLGARPLVGALLDLGVSSPQLDQAERGFSFYHEGPLDMRMDTSCGETAADLVNTLPSQELKDIFQNYGEVFNSARVVDAIVERRKSSSFKSTRDLSDLIVSCTGWRKKGFHPATQYFMALRIAVNRELSRIEEVLPELVKSILPGGRLLVISFHSLEDRIVKRIFKTMKEQGLGIIVNKKVIQATWDEKKQNPRSRSAKLRIFQSTGVTV